jgi:hypothetical protein
VRIDKEHWLGAFTFAVMAAIPHAATAESESAILDVSAIVPAICKISDLDLELDLGTVTAGERQRTGNVAVDVTCPEGIPYALTLDDREQAPMEASDKASAGTPIATTAVIIGAERSSASSRLSRIGSGSPDQAIIQVTADFSGKEIAGSYSKQITFTIDW